MSPRPTREHAHERIDMITRIKAVAQQQMAEHGTAGLSLRGIAREMGITAPAIYNYFPRLDDLITALIVDAFTALADAIEAAESAVESEACGPKILASCLAYREWAIAHPVDFQLIYGNPIPGYVAPAEMTVPLARRPFDGLFRLFLRGLSDRRTGRPGGVRVRAGRFTAHFATWLPEATGIRLPGPRALPAHERLGAHSRHGDAGAIRASRSGSGGLGGPSTATSSVAFLHSAWSVTGVPKRAACAAANLVTDSPEVRRSWPGCY